jgi:hypothetical protein
MVPSSDFDLKCSFLRLDAGWFTDDRFDHAEDKLLLLPVEDGLSRLFCLSIASGPNAKVLFLIKDVEVLN